MSDAEVGRSRGHSEIATLVQPGVEADDVVTGRREHCARDGADISPAPREQNSHDLILVRTPQMETPAANVQSTRPSRTQALWPPRPIAFESATSTSTLRASFGT